MKAILPPPSAALNQFRDFSLNALLHLEFKRLENKHPLSSQKVNSLLQSFIKKSATKAKYKPIKKRLKSLLSTSLKQRIDLESFLLQLTDWNADLQITDLEEFLLLVRELEKEFNSQLILSKAEEVDLNHNPLQALLCVLANNLNDNFSTAGKLISQITFLARLSTFERSCLFHVLSRFSRFDISIMYQDDKFIRFNMYLTDS
ncbi:DUF2913 family protein [Vibrio chagasii]|uniref:DUF2913 family protein n=1 Tax=Vibrio chagasii TaxID=170679 RepID=UPI003D9FB6F5